MPFKREFREPIQMTVKEINMNDPAARKQVARLTDLIYRDIPQWVPPLSSEMARILDPKRNEYLNQGQAAFFLASGSAQTPVGRIAVFNNTRYNEHQKTRTAFFTLFECLDDPAAAQELFSAAETWAKSHGLTSLVGPKGFTALDGFGMLIKGFEHRPAFGIPYNPPYYPLLLEKAGFLTHGDTVSGYLSGENALPEKIHRAAALIQKRRGLRVASFQRRQDLRILVPRLKDLYNEAIQGTSETYPLSDQEADDMANQLLRFADPRLIKVIFKDDDPVGFLLAYPDISAAVQRTRGKLFPFGWADLLLEMRRTTWVNINGMGIVPEYRGLGGTALLFSEMEKSIKSRNFKHADLVQIGLENDRMQRELAEFGIDFYKIHRVYSREF
jgi:GNAT superfamily N-acetyltransferase